MKTTILAVVLCLALLGFVLGDVTVTNITAEQRAALAALKQQALSGQRTAFLDLCRYMMELGLHAQAATMCEKFIQLSSDADVDADLNLRDAYRLWGESLRETGRYTLSAKAFAVAFKAGDDAAAGGLVLSLTWTARFEAAQRAIRAAQIRTGSPHVGPMFTPWVALLLGFSPREALLSARAASQSAAASALPAAAATKLRGAGAAPAAVAPPRMRAPLVIAYASADFNGFAPVGHDLKRALGMHDRSRVHTVCVALTPEDGSPLRAAMRQTCPQFVSVAGLSAQAAAERVRALQPDIVVDLTGHTAGHRLDMLSLRPAAVQIAMKGYMGSMGAPFIDYGVADRVAVPPDRAQYFDERLAIFPRTVFVCDLKQILKRTPNSVLWLLKFPPDAAPVLHAAAEAAGVPRDRVIFTGLFSAKEHLSIKGLADVFLDTLRFNAHGTAAEALWAGLPVVTLPGETMAQRVAAGIVEAALTDQNAWAARYLIAGSTEDYVQKAVALGRDADLYERVASAVRSSRLSAPLFDTKGWMHGAEVLYGMTADLRAAGRSPAHLVLHRDSIRSS